ncbi:hypothetical protein [Agriterribacter sp.]|mgnify:CR=1 FL=1|uniref:hypothetical protein n=1 Tax=Agriterribacter sp. TaxID=2821509 RepID=UPI002BA5EC0B|nr:hypothetical protein [Agriterribacter sp.]HRP56636.1 hypothetical protein [Agriterribacter sp.]
MSLKNVKLPETLIANLYTAPLAGLQNTAGAPTSTTTGLKFLGSNQKQITILVNVSDATYLSDRSFAFLTGVLNACKLNMADVAVININQYTNHNYIELNSITQPRIQLLFGVSPREIGLPIHFPHFQVQPYNNVVYLCAPDLNSIEEDKSLKTRLWAGLKSIFQL